MGHRERAGASRRACDQVRRSCKSVLGHFAKITSRASAQTFSRRRPRLPPRALPISAKTPCRPVKNCWRKRSAPTGSAGVLPALLEVLADAAYEAVDVVADRLERFVVRMGGELLRHLREGLQP